MSSNPAATAKRIHFIGIGGIGMSALVRFFLHEGREVSGSDRSTSAITEALAAEGATVCSSQRATNITPDIELVVYTEAMMHDHEEMVAARSLGVPMVNYFEALGLVANEYYLIAVAGSHGKTTTTAMLIDILEVAGFDPTAIVGSLRAKTGSNFRAGKSKYAIVEACEFRRDFLHLNPDVLVITNIDYEHVDYYKDLADVQSAFRTLAEKVPKEGFVIADTTHAHVVPVVTGLTAMVVDYRPHIRLEQSIKLPGLHNRMNAAAATAAARVIGIPSSVSTEALEGFSGTWRRFEYKGKVNGALVYDDYAHHPKENAAAIAGARELYPHKQLVVVFQSHTYTRTHELFVDFAEALARADQVIMLPIYSAREENESGVTAESLVDAINAIGTPAKFVPTSEAAVALVQQTATPDSIVLVMGAGDVTKVASLLTI
ncbi:UDP-N-acetylmuramate--L-alanine ligase [Patescibacteria group bacterium]|nr:UDP-N-acetylmuramate--L-alanine ligase [Patescibacteria group bacterium]